MPDDVLDAANRCLIVGFDGHTVPDEVRQLIAEGLGGVILASRNVRDAEQVRALTDSLRAERADVLISIDSEGGGIGHLARTGVPETPGSLALGVVDDVEVTAAVARSLAAHLSNLGIGIAYAPVVDVQLERGNPIVRTRSFGSDPALVGRHAAAWIQAHAEYGVGSCAKHFPGHGSTTVDSHIGLPTDRRPVDELSEIDLVPFRDSIAAGVQMIMTAHVVYPAWDSAPATLSRRILTELLRTELGFEGVVVTDALEMKAIADGVGEAAGAPAALAAGADTVLIARPNPALWYACRDSVVSAVRSGALPESRLYDSAARIRILAAGYANPPGAAQVPDAGAGLAAARGAVRSRLSPGPLRDPFVVDLFRAPHPAFGWDGFDLITHLRAVLPGVDGSAATSADQFDVAKVLSAAAGRQLVIATDDPVLRPWQAEARRALLTERPDAVLVSTGMPEADEFCTFGRGHANLTAGAEALA